MAFYNRLLLVPEPNNILRPILHMSTLDLYYKVKTFKMVFGLSTAPMEFHHCRIKKVNLMAQAKGIRIHQYIDNWLISVPIDESCFWDIETLLSFCQDPGRAVNMKIGLQASLWLYGLSIQSITRHGQIHHKKMASPKLENQIPSVETTLLSMITMSLLGLLIVTEKQVCNGHVHMRLIQWHLKNNCHVPESLEKTIPAPRSFHTFLGWWLEKVKLMPDQSFNPFSMLFKS